MRARRSLLARQASALGATLLVGITARAGNAENAEALFQSGREAMARGDLAVACPRLAESQRLDPAAGTLLNLAECEERSGKLASALLHFQEAHDELPPEDYRVPFASERIEKLAPRVPKLILKTREPAAPGTTVTRDGTTFGLASLEVAFPVDPGVHVCALRAPGHADGSQEVWLREGETRTVELVPGPLLPARPPTAARGSMQRRWAIGVGAAGAAGLVTGAVFGVTSKLTYDSAAGHCRAGATTGCTSGAASGSQSAYTQALVSDVAFVSGAALLALGVTLFFTAPSERPAVLPAVGPREAGLVLQGPF